MDTKDKERTTASRQTGVPDLPEHVDIENMADYDVYDSANEKIGTTTAIWMDRRNQPAFIGVKTSKLFGKTHVIPAFAAEVNHEAHRIRIPCRGDVVSDAPTYATDAQLDVNAERDIIDYFRSKGCLGGAAPGWPHYEEKQESRAAGQATIPLHEEDVKVGKRTVEAGGVRLRKVVRRETVQQPVELKREEIKVERVPASGQQVSGKAFQGEDVYIPLRREEPVVQKEARVREEVRASTASSTERRNVSGEVRKEDVEVEHDRQRKAA